MTDMATTPRTKELLGRIYDDVRQAFEANKRILSFSEFMAQLVEHPQRHARSAAQYVHDCFEHWGVQTHDGIAGTQTRYTLFDAPFDPQGGKMVGQERAQQRVFGLIDGFARAGRSDKLILLHGPNGSAKSTFVQTLVRALEAYSETDEGAIYRFNWIFPTEKLSAAGSIGFSDTVISKENLETFAHLDDDQIEARLSGALRDHPLLLLPVDLRQKVLGDALDGAHQSDFVVSRYIGRGDLSMTNRQIFDALLTAYKGDLESVLKHVQIERYFFSKRYRNGVVTVEPQMRVDAGVRQITADRSLQSLPPVLQNLTLFEPMGDLVDANRGVIEYDDMFKRHPDLNKYLLSASERASVSLDNVILHLDTIMIATGNETYLDAFKQSPEYASFKGRVELVRLPYLLDWRAEQEIYDAQLLGLDVGKFIAPHTTFVASLWAVLTRLKRPQPDHYDGALRDVIAALDPLEKARLYAGGEVPEELSAERARDLAQSIEEMLDEGANSNAYEGRFGASPREIKMILLSAAQSTKFPNLSPLAVFDELDELVRDPTVFPFLQMKPDGEYYRHDRFIETVRQAYAEVLDAEVQEAMGLVDEAQYHDLFSRYIDHVSQSLKGEKVYNPITKTYDVPDEKFMREIEETMGAGLDQEDEERREFRANLISTIGASFMDNPDETIDYRRVFPKLFGTLKRSFYEERSVQIKRTQELLLDYLDGDETMDAADVQLVTQTLERLRERCGHTTSSAKEAVAFLLSRRDRIERTLAEASCRFC